MFLQFSELVSFNDFFKQQINNNNANTNSKTNKLIACSFFNLNNSCYILFVEN